MTIAKKALTRTFFASLLFVALSEGTMATPPLSFDYIMENLDKLASKPPQMHIDGDHSEYERCTLNTYNPYMNPPLRSSDGTTIYSITIEGCHFEKNAKSSLIPLKDWWKENKHKWKIEEYGPQNFSKQTVSYHIQAYLKEEKDWSIRILYEVVK